MRLHRPMLLCIAWPYNRSGSLLDLAENVFSARDGRDRETASFSSCVETERRKRCIEW